MASLFDLFSEELSGKGSQFYPSSHNTSPITFYPQQCVIDHFQTLDQKLKRNNTVDLGIKLIERYEYKNHVEGSLRLCIEVGPVYYSVMSSTLIKRSSISNRAYLECKESLRSSVQAGVKCLRSEALGVIAHHPILNSDLIEHLDSVLNSQELIDLILPSYSIRDFLESFRSLMQVNIVSNNTKYELVNYGDMHFITNGSVILVVYDNEPTTVYILNYDQLSMLTDVVTSRYCSLLACGVNSLTKRSLLPTPEELRQVYEWGDNLLRDYGLEAYAVIGEFESLVTCKLVRFPGTDPLDLGAQYEDSIRANAIEVEMETKINRKWVSDLFNILESINSVNKLSEIFGLRKHWGNPMLDAKLSGRAVQQKAAEEYPLNREALLDLLASFQRMIILSYIHVEGRWPDCEIEEGYDELPLVQQYKAGNIRVNEFSVGYDIKDWSRLIFKRNVNIDKCINPLDILSDKSCSFYRPNLDFVYVKGYRTDPNVNRTPAESRRLLLEYLRREHYTMEDIFKIVQSEQVPDEWLVNLCALKGTEMKHMKGRIFAVLTYELRQYFSGTEELIKKYIFPYNPHQTMTMKEYQLTDLLNEITSQLNPDVVSKDLNVVFIIDFSKWNLRMSEENTELVFRSIDNFLGTPNLIEATHYLFELMVNVVQDAFDPPSEGVQNTVSDTIWWLHSRGWEGQRQKGWTALTSALLALIEAKTGVFSRIIGQGDNQIMCSRFRVPDPYNSPREWIEAEPNKVKERVENFYDTVVNECLKIGLPVKKSETCQSLSFCNYGKRLFHSSIELTMELKRISKIATESNETFPTTDALLKTIAGATSASQLYGPPSLTSLIVGYINVAYLLSKAIYRNPLAGEDVKKALAMQGIRCSSDLIRGMMLIPTSLGGPYRPNLANSFFRGHPDPLAAEFAGVVLSARANSSYHRKILEYLRTQKFEIGDKKDGMKGLIKAPYSLNVVTPGNPMTPLLKEVERALKGYCKNPEIKPLFTNDFDDYERDLIKDLSIMKPFHPVIANEIYKRSLVGRKEAFISGFDNTGSFAKLLDNSSDALRLKLIEKEVSQIVWWAKTAFVISDLPYVPDNSSVPNGHILLQQIRELTWGVRIEGVTVPHPLEMMILTPAPYGVCGEHCLKYEREKIELVLLDDGRNTLPGVRDKNRICERSKKRKGYTGNTIAEGMICKRLKVVNHSSAIDDAIRLNVIRRWVTSPGSSLDSLIIQLIAQRTDLTVSQLNDLSGLPARVSYTHRVAAIATTKKCSAACISNLFSQIYISSNNMGKYSRDEVNYSLTYGQTFLFAQHMVGLLLFYGQEGFYSNQFCLHAHVKDDSIPIVYDGSLSLCDQPTLSLTERITQEKCKLLFLSKEDVELEERGVIDGTVSWKTLENSSLRIARLAFGSQLIGDTLLKEERLKSLLGVRNMVVFNRRATPISVGDILAIGLSAYINSLSNSLVLLLPWDIVFHVIKMDFSTCVVRVFLDGFGSACWRHLFSPIMTPSLLKSFASMTQGIKNTTFGVTFEDLQRELIVVISKHVCHLLKSCYEDIFEGNKKSSLTIFADGPHATRFLATRVLEIYLAMISTHSKHMLPPDLKKISNSLKSSILEESESKELSVVIQLIKSSFHEAQMQLVGDTGRPPLDFPNLTFADMNLPWAVKIRESEKPNLPSQLRLANYLHIPKYGLRTDLTLQIKGCEVQINQTELICDCPHFLRHVRVEIERYAMFTGVSSKSHYAIVELISRYSLPIEGVVSIGFRAGTEIAFLASMSDCKRVCSNPLLSLSAFADHTAGSYIPAEFIGYDIEKKLFKPAEIILGHEGGSYLKCFRPMVSQLKGEQWDGLILKLDPFLEMNTWVQCLLTVHNACMVASYIVKKPGWIIVELPMPCGAVLESVVSILSDSFLIIEVTVSSFQSFPGGLIHLVAHTRKKIARMESANQRLLYSLLSTEDSTLLKAWRLRVLKHSVPGVLRRYVKGTAGLDPMAYPLPVGIDKAFANYLPGWESDNNFKVSAVIMKLEKYMVSCVYAVDEMKLYADKHRDSQQLPTGMMFFVPSRNMMEAVNDIGNWLERAKLLTTVLTLANNVTIEDLILMVTNFILSKHTIRFGEKDVKIKLIFSKFMKLYSGDLFEIVGFLTQRRLKGHLLRAPILDLHFQGRRPTQTLYTPLDKMSYVHNRDYPIDLSFSWPRRSYVLLMIFAKTLYPRKVVYVLSHMNDWVLQVTKLLGIEHILSVNEINHPGGEAVIIAFESNPLALVEEHILYTMYEVLICEKREEAFKYAERGVLNSVYRPPYLGVTPQKGWLVLTPSGGYKETASLSTDWSSTSHYWMGNSTTGCRCRDCATESLLTAEESTDFHHYLSNFCSENSDVQSIFDIEH